MDQLQILATQKLPDLLAKSDPPRPPRTTIMNFSPTSPTASSLPPKPTLHNLPRTHTNLPQAWENERENIFAQLFRSFCFSRTSAGFPGLGAFRLKGLRARDKVVLLEDAPMPMVLRKSGLGGDREEEGL